MADQIELDSLYSQAQAALKAKQYDRASDLLRQILLADENYKDASRLLARAVRLRRRRWYSHPLLWGVIGIAALAVIGIWAAPQLGRFYASRVAQPTNRPTNTETPSLTPTPAPTAVPLAWKRISIGLEFPRDAIVSALIDENDSDVMYVGTRSAGVYRSIDGGLSWQPDHDPEIEQRLSSSVFRPPEGEGSSPVISINAENGETYSYRLSGGIVEESKNGKPWQYLLATRCSYLLEYSESQAFAYCGKLYSLPTADPVGRALPIVDFSAVDWGGVPLAIAVSAQSPDIIIIGGEWGLFITKDGGETWEERTNGLGSRTVELTISPQGLFFAQDRSTFDPGGNGGWACNLYRSLDRAQTWTKLPKAVANTGCGLSFSADGNTLFLNDASWNVRNSTDNGDSSIPWGG